MSQLSVMYSGGGLLTVLQVKVIEYYLKINVYFNQMILLLTGTIRGQHTQNTDNIEVLDGTIYLVNNVQNLIVK